MQPKLITRLLLSTAYIFLCFNSFGQVQAFNDQLSDDPVLFYPNELAQGNLQWNNWLANNETELFYTIQEKQTSFLVKRRVYHDNLGPIERLPFDPKYNYSHPWVSEKGDHLIFQASLPNPESQSTDFRIWEAYLTDEGWSKPTLFSEATSTKDHEGSPILSKAGNLYFNMTKEDNGDADLFVLKKGDKKATKLPKTINSKQFEGDFFVDKEEKYIIFSSYERDESAGKSDLYISFKAENTWSVAVWLGKEINSPEQDFSPYVTNDGEHMIFTSSRLSQHLLRPSFNHFIVKFDLEKYR